MKGTYSSKVTLRAPGILEISGLMCDLQDTNMPMDTVVPRYLLVSSSSGVDFASATFEQLALVARTSFVCGITENLSSKIACPQRDLDNFPKRWQRASMLS